MAQLAGGFWLNTITDLVPTFDHDCSAGNRTRPPLLTVSRGASYSISSEENMGTVIVQTVIPKPGCRAQLALAEACNSPDAARPGWMWLIQRLSHAPFPSLGLVAPFTQPCRMAAISCSSQSPDCSPYRSVKLLPAQNDTRNIPGRILICWACIMTQTLKSSWWQARGGTL